MQMTGNDVLVTGGGSGIGRGIAESLHRLGNRVIVAGRREAALKEIAQANPGMHYLTFDQTDPADIARLAADLATLRPHLNVLINNAGVQRPENLTIGDIEAAELQVTTNLLGPLRLTAALIPRLTSRPVATIVNVTSGLAFVPNAAVPTYCATKAALHSYTQSLRYQLRNTTIEVIEIIPPQVRTALRTTMTHARCRSRTTSPKRWRYSPPAIIPRSTSRESNRYATPHTTTPTTISSGS